MRIASRIAEANLIHDVPPQYPPEAGRARIEGAVVLMAVIGTDGSVKDVRVESGLPILVQAAIDAVRQWRYKPYLIDGEPVEVDSRITINFTLSELRSIRNAAKYTQIAWPTFGIALRASPSVAFDCHRHIGRSSTDGGAVFHDGGHDNRNHPRNSFRHRDDPIAGASVILQGPAGDRLTAITKDDGGFAFEQARGGVAYQITVTAEGFANWNSSITVETGSE
jgi:TonB family protein